MLHENRWRDNRSLVAGLADSNRQPPNGLPIRSLIVG
jgi:hypothetical protein